MSEWVVVPAIASREMELYGTNLMLRAEDQGGRSIAVDIYAEMISARPTGPEVPKILEQRTEAEWREEWRNWYNPDAVNCPVAGFAGDCAVSINSWLAALRLVGAIKEDKK